MVTSFGPTSSSSARVEQCLLVGQLLFTLDRLLLYVTAMDEQGPVQQILFPQLNIHLHLNSITPILLFAEGPCKEKSESEGGEPQHPPRRLQHFLHVLLSHILFLIFLEVPLLLHLPRSPLHALFSKGLFPCSSFFLANSLHVFFVFSLASLGLRLLSA